MLLEKSGKMVKAHIRYMNESGKRVPGVTTLIGILNKPALVPWANNLGLQGINVKDYVDDKADIGTLDHEMMYVNLINLMSTFPDSNVLWEEVDENNIPIRVKEYYTGLQIEIAQIGFKKYLDWKERHTIVPIMLEKGLVSEKYQYGGTIDSYCLFDGVPTLIDYKTSKAIWSEYFIQVSAYRQLLIEAGHKVDNCAILRVGRNELEGFEFCEITQEKLNLSWELFLHCVGIYNLQKKIK